MKTLRQLDIRSGAFYHHKSDVAHVEIYIKTVVKTGIEYFVTEFLPQFDRIIDTAYSLDEGTNPLLDAKEITDEAVIAKLMLAGLR